MKYYKGGIEEIRKYQILILHLNTGITKLNLK